MSEPKFEAEAKVCRLTFRNDRTLYLKQINKLYSAELTEIRHRYKIAADNTLLTEDDRESSLLELQEEQALCIRLKLVIQELLEERKKFSGSKVLHKGRIRVTASNGDKINFLHKCVAKMRSLQPSISESEATEYVRLVTPEYEWC